MLEHLPELVAAKVQKYDALWLRAWQRSSGLSNVGAARRLGLSDSAYRRQKTGRARLGAQTILLAMYSDVHSRNWLDLAEMAGELAKLNGCAR